MRVELATLQDIPRLCQLLKVLFGEEREFHYDEEKQTRGLGMILENPAIGQIFVLKEEDYIIGMVSFLWSVSMALGEKVAWLEDMVIDPAFQHKGYGKHLLKEALLEMKKATCKRVTLLTDATNIPAQTLYSHLGFEHSSMKAMRHFIL